MFRRFGFYIIAIVFVPLMLLLSLEMFARFRSEPPSPEDKKMVSTWEDLYASRKTYFKAPLLCEEKPPSEKTPGTYRIVTVGGSTTLDIPTTSECRSNYSFFLESALRDQLGRESIEILNGGLPSLRTAGVLKRLNHVILPLEPDLLIIHSVLNHTNYLLAFSKGNIEVDGEKSEVIFKADHLNLLERTNFYLMRHSRFYQWLGEFVGAHMYGDAGIFWKKRLPQVEKSIYRFTAKEFTLPENKELVAAIDRVVGEHERLLVEIIQTARNHGIRVVLVQPPINIEQKYAYGIDIESTNFDEARKKMSQRLLGLMAFKQGFNRALRGIERIGLKFNVPVVNATMLFGDFPGRSDFFRDLDWVHLNSKGNEMLGSLIAQDIIKNDFISE